MLVIFLKVKVSKRVNETCLVWKKNPDIVSQLIDSVSETRSVWKFHIYLKMKPVMWNYVLLEYVNRAIG